MIQIPKQLQNKEFRFILLGKAKKEPLEQEWQRKNNYQFNDLKLLKHLESDKNYGIVSGFGSLAVIDGDTKEIMEIVKDKLPSTFSVKTSKGEHYYYKTDKPLKPIRLSKIKQGDLGDVRGIGQYVVGANCIHPSGAKYKVWNNLPITNISEEVIRSTFPEYIDKADATELREFPITTTKRSSIYIRECQVPDYLLNNKLKPNMEKNAKLFRFVVDILHNREVNENVYFTLAAKQGHPIGAIQGWVKMAREGKLGKSSCRLMREYLERFAPDLVPEICRGCILYKKNKENPKLDTVAQEKQKKREKPILLSKYINEEKGIFAEQVYDEENGSRFCIYNIKTGEVTYKKFIESSGLTFMPQVGEEIEKKAIILPSKAEEYNAEKELDAEIITFAHKWLDVPKNVSQFGLWNTKRSWVFERFHTLNYLRALGDTGTGKTRYTDVWGYIHYKPIFTTGATTPAPLFRIIDKWRGTLVMDEADLRKSDESEQIIKIINQGFEKNRFIMRCDQNDAEKILFFDPYCPKILATRKPFEDKATESRCITHVSSVTDRKDIPLNLNKEFFEEAKNIRNKLLMWRFKNYFKIDKTLKYDLGDLEPRVKQIVSSYIYLFSGNKEQMEKFKKYIKQYQEELIEERQTSFYGVIVGAIHSLLEKEQTIITTGDIVNEGGLVSRNGQPMQPRGISSSLKSLGFGKTTSTRVGNKTERCIPMEAKHLSKLFKRYGYDVTVVTVVKGVSENIEKDNKIDDFSKKEDQTTNRMHRNLRNTVTDDNNKKEPKQPKADLEQPTADPAHPTAEPHPKPQKKPKVIKIKDFADNTSEKEEK